MKDINSIADQLGYLNAQIADLQDEAKSLKGDLIESGYDQIEGDHYNVSVVRSERANVNWQKIARDLGASDRKIAANTKKSETVSVCVYGRSAKVA